MSCRSTLSAWHSCVMPWQGEFPDHKAAPIEGQYKELYAGRVYQIQQPFKHLNGIRVGDKQGLDMLLLRIKKLKA